MLYNQSLTAFLNANRSSHIHTLFISTPQGKLLCSSSPIPVATLRAQATIACSIWTLYKPLTASGAIAAALPPSQHVLGDEEDDDGNEGPSPDPDVTSIAIQLENGTMVVRALTCSLIFAVIGPSSLSTSTSSLSSLASGLSYLSVGSSTTSPPPSSHSTMVNGEGGIARRHGEPSFSDINGLASSAASMAGSASGTVVGSIKVLRKQSEQLAKWLNGELEGLSISSGL